MKLQEVSFPRPVKVMQVFRNIHVYDKTSKSFDDRRQENEWKPMASVSGYVMNGELFLPEQVLQDPLFTNGDLITLEDDNTPLDPRAGNHSLEGKTNQCFQQVRQVNLHIFSLKITANIELHLHYDYFTIGIPERDNFKICDLQPGKPVEIKINGKTDSSLSSRRDRVFKEQQYVLEYLGEFSGCKIMRKPFSTFAKSVPVARKVVDMNKSLW